MLKGQPAIQTNDKSDKSIDKTIEKPVITSLLISRMHVKRILRRQPDTKAFIAFVTEAKVDTPTKTPDSLQALLDEYSWLQKFWPEHKAGV